VLIYEETPIEQKKMRYRERLMTISSSDPMDGFFLKKKMIVKHNGKWKERQTLNAPLPTNKGKPIEMKVDLAAC